MSEPAFTHDVFLSHLSANAFGSDWSQLESGTFRFRDPVNKERRFIPLRLDGAPIKQFQRSRSPSSRLWSHF